MATHKIAALTQNAVKGPSALKSSGPHKTECRQKSTETGAVVPDTVAYILKKSNGDLEKASKLLDEKLTETNCQIKELTQSKSQLTDEQFYQRLTELKQQQKSTVAMCEDLYCLTQRQQAAEDEYRQPKTVTFRDDQSTARRSEFIRASLAELERRVSLDGDWRESAPASKPPLPRSSARIRAEQEFQPPFLSRPAAAAGVTRSLSASLDGHRWANGVSDEDLDEFVDGEDDGNEEEEEAGIRSREFDDDEEAALRLRYRQLLRSTTTKSAWSRVRPRAGSLDRNWRGADRQDDRLDRRQQQQQQQGEWRHRVTIPQPFSMTLRDEYSKSGKKSRSMILFEEDAKRRQEAEEAECRVRFKANPVPAHVFMPLYDELEENRENRRREIRQHSRELLRSQERPFAFAKRDEERKRQERPRQTEADRNRQPQRSTKGDRRDTIIRARPVPSSVRQPQAQRIQEDEILRQIRVRMRAEKNLRMSAAPGEMMQRQRRMEQKRMERLAKFQTPGKRQRPHSADARLRVGRDAPDFDRLHRAFQLELLERQADARVTRPSPFRLRTEKRGQQIQQKTEENLQRQRDPKTAKTLRDHSQRYPTDERSSRSIGSYEDAPPARLTHSAQLREGRRSFERQTEEQRRRRAEAEQLQMKQRRRQLAESLRVSTSDVDAALGPSVKERTRNRLEAQRELEEDYKQKLRELNEKVKERDLLVVQQAKLIAQQKARSRYRQTLLDAGVDPKKVDEMAKNYQESDVAAYAEDFESSLPADASEFDEDKREEMDETRFGMPSPVPE